MPSVTPKPRELQSGVIVSLEILGGFQDGTYRCQLQVEGVK